MAGPEDALYGQLQRRRLDRLRWRIAGKDARNHPRPDVDVPETAQVFRRLVEA